MTFARFGYVGIETEKSRLNGANPNKEDKVNGEWPLMGMLRFYLACVVMISHLPSFAPTTMLTPELLWLSHNGGVAAVCCFFVVSGYSIAASLAREMDRFYWRRAIRIYPTYLFCYVLSVVLWLKFGLRTHTPRNLDNPRDVTALVYIMQAVGLPWILTPAIGVFGQSWSLSCEIVYYALAPMLKRLGGWALLLVGVFSYWAFVRQNRYDWAWCYDWPVICLFWIWLTGWAFYQKRHQFLAAGLLVVVMLIVIYRGQIVARIVMFVFALLILIFGKYISIPIKFSKLLIFLGEISYPLYLSHIVILMTTQRLLGKKLVHDPYVYLIICAVIAIVIYIGIDRPARRQLTKFLLS